jgi:hypothetical protein
MADNLTTSLHHPDDHPEIIKLRDALIDTVANEAWKAGTLQSTDARNSYIVFMAGLEFTLGWLAEMDSREESDRLKSHIMRFFAETRA